MGQAVAGADVVYPVVSRAGDDVAVEPAGCQVPVLVFATDLSSVHRAIGIAKYGDISRQQLVYPVPDPIEVGYLGDFHITVFHP